MLRTLLACSLVSSVALHAAPPETKVPAFPGAIGHGAAATGGRGGEVYHVTNLDDAGPGSFRDAVSKPDRIVVFDIGGAIELKSIVPVASNITIAGQTAPGGGIEVRHYEVSVSHQSNIIVRHVRFRMGMTEKMRKKYTIGATQASDIIFDHCTIVWGRWDCIGMSKSNRITFQNCIIGQAVDPQRFGAIVESDNVTFARNLWIHNQSRSPKAKGRIEYINNVVYNWGVCGLGGGHSAAEHSLDVIGNVFIAGPNSNDRYTGQYTQTDLVHQSDNLVDLDKDGQFNPAQATIEQFADTDGFPTTMPTGTQDKAKFETPVLTARETLEHVLQHTGASLSRDHLDQALIADVRSLGRSGKIIRHTDELPSLAMLPTNREAPLDTDRDGMPDAWESARDLDPNDPADARADRDNDGYTNIEEYVNELASPKRP